MRVKCFSNPTPKTVKWPYPHPTPRGYPHLHRKVPYIANTYYSTNRIGFLEKTLNHTVRVLPALAILIFLQACETAPKVLSISEVNRDAGNVKLTTTVGGLRTLVVDWEGSESVARRSCQSWGYNGAQRLDNRIRTCESIGTSEAFEGQCNVYRYTYTYQCTGSPTSNVQINNSSPLDQNRNLGESLVDDLKQIQELYDSGVLSDEEFNAAKRRLLGI